jgi:hypothetical protein
MFESERDRMTVDFVRARLAALQRLIPGIATAYDRIPASINNAELPAFVNRAAEARYNMTTLGEQAVSEERLYFMELYVAEIETGAPGQSEDMTVPFVDTVRDFFLARPQLQIDDSTEAVYRAVLESDTGAVVGIEYPQGSGKRYAGIRFSLRVYEIHHIAYIG